MIRVTIKIPLRRLYDYVRATTVVRVYDPANNEANTTLRNIYGITDDDMEVVEEHCLKPACNYVYMAIKRHTWSPIPFIYNTPHHNVMFRLVVGRTKGSPSIETGKFNDIIADYIMMSIRDYTLKEWYKMKGHMEFAAFHEAEFEKNKRLLLDITQGVNADSGNINIAQKHGFPFN